MAKTKAKSKKKKKKIQFSSEVIYRVDENGELHPMTAEVIDEEFDETVDVNFDKIWLGAVFDALEQVGNKKMKVASYILNSRDTTTNYIIKTQRQIAEECGVSLQTVSTTLRALEEADLLVGKSGVYQVNPEKIARGKHNKRMAILRIYKQNKNSKKDI